MPFYRLLSAQKSTWSLAKCLHSVKMPLIRRGTVEDAPEILELYKEVASIYPDRLTQQIDEITLTYIQSILHQACLRGLVLLMFENGKLLGYMKGYTSEFRRQAHVLGNGTAMVKPSSIGQGHVHKLYQTYHDEIQTSMRHIRLVEIVPHDSNIHAIRLNEKLVFVRQASLPNKIRYANGTFGSEIVMQWINPHFCELSLLRYHEYLRGLSNKTSSSTLER